MRFTDKRIESWAVGALLDAEGSVLKSTAAKLLDSSGLTAEDFTNPTLKAVVGAIRTISDGGRLADAQTVYAVCKGLEGFADSAYEKLRTLQASNVVNGPVFATHAEQLRRLTLLRRVEKFLRDQLEAIGVERPDPKALALNVETFAQTLAASSATDETGDADVLEVLDDWDAHAAGKRQPYVPTGIEIVDEHLGGWVPNLNVVGGMESVGKSAFAAESIMCALERGEHVGVFGLEDATKWITKRHLSRRMGIPVGDIAAVRLNEHQQERLQVSAGELHGLLKNLHVYRKAGIDPATLIATCRRWIVNHGVKSIWIDHGGEVQHQGGIAKDRYDLAVGSTYRALRDVAVNAKVPIIVLCHFNRDTDTKQGGIPKRHNFGNSQEIIRMARVALGLWTKEGDNRLRCTVLKRTEGARDVTVGIPRDTRHALVRRTGGEVIDLSLEAKENDERFSWAK